MDRKIDPATIGSPAAELNAPPPPPSRGKVVIAEDDDATRMLLRQILTSAGFRVDAVADGKLACEAVRLQRPDVILLDWLMPVMDGLSAAKLLKEDIATRAIPIVMITTRSKIEDRDLALEIGVQDFVPKPFVPAELVACIDQQMRWREIIVTARAADRRVHVVVPRKPEPVPQTSRLHN